MGEVKKDTCIVKWDSNTTKNSFLGSHFRDPDDNLTDMLIRELSEEQFSLFVNYAPTVSWMICKLTPEQKAQALMETYADGTYADRENE